jgi:hypothetical protein
VIQELAQVAVEVGSSRRELSTPLCDSQLATQVRDGSAATTHCHATARVLTREYQGDYRRTSLSLGCGLRQLPVYPAPCGSP